MTWLTCPVCGKRSFPTKHMARRVRRQMRDRRGLSVYECAFGGWHVGHLPWAVRRGEVTRGEIYEEGAF